MFDTIILLTGPAEQKALAAALRNHNPQLVIRPAETLPDIEALKPALLLRARLIGFLTPVMVPKLVLDALGYGAYNFHPGPPEYPGWVPSHFAIYDGAKSFGATAHLMAVKVDAGPIVGVGRFAIPPNTSVLELERLAFVEVARLFWRLVPALATQEDPLPPLSIQWGGRKSTRKKYRALCNIPPDISKDELDRRMQAFGAVHFGIHPTVTLHGHRFRYELAEAKDAPASRVPTLALEPA
jgi:methionyl-tRNA formyltransferase